MVGPHLFQKDLQHPNPSIMNRSLFMEYCGTHEMSVVNTLFDYPEEYLVTYHNLVSAPKDPISTAAFSQIDYVMCSQQATDMIQDCWTDRSISPFYHDCFGVNPFFEKPLQDETI